MSESSPFDYRPDRELGDLLRAALSTAGESAFVGQVMTAVDRREAGETGEPPWWQVLGMWAWPGLAAALALAAGATIWAATQRRNDTEATLEAVFRARAESVAAPFLVATAAPPSFDRVLASSLEP